MKLSFLIQLVLLLLLVISVYMVFTNSVGGRIKLILIVFCVVLGLYLFSKLNPFKDYDEFFSTPRSARKPITIESTELKKSEGHFTISTWIFIDDWNHRYGKTKDILKKTDTSDNELLYIGLNEFKNDLIIRVKGFDNPDPDSTTEPFCNLMKSSNIEGFSMRSALDAADDILDTNTDEALDVADDILDTNTDEALDAADDILDTAMDEAVDTAYDILDTPPSVTTSDPTNIQLEPITIKNIPMQKWVNIITSIGDNTIDVYINGKLVKTTTYNNVINDINEGKIIVADNDGFGGFVSRIRHLPRFITPEEAWNIYTDGFGDAFESALNKYNMSLSFYQDSIEQNKFFLF